MHRNTVDWAGYIPAITTPFTRSGALDWAALDAQLQWYLQERMHGVVLAGTSGEWFSLSAAERAELFAQAGRMIAGRITVLGGCNAYTAAEAIGHARAAERAGLDGILLTPPPYIVPSRRELVQFYTDVSDASDIPICIYKWPRGCVVDMDVELLEELAEIDHVVAIKNSTGNFAQFLQGAYALRDKVRYFNMPTTELGADLARLGVSDRLLAAGDKAGALVLGKRDRVLMKAWFNQDFAGRFGSAQAILKTALRLRGVPAGHVRRPLLELTADDVAQVRAPLEGLGIATAALAGACPGCRRPSGAGPSASPRWWSAAACSAVPSATCWRPPAPRCCWWTRASSTPRLRARTQAACISSWSTGCWKTARWRRARRPRPCPCICTRCTPGVGSRPSWAPIWACGNKAV